MKNLPILTCHTDDDLTLLFQADKSHWSMALIFFYYRLEADITKISSIEFTKNQ